MKLFNMLCASIALLFLIDTKSVASDLEPDSPLETLQATSSPTQPNPYDACAEPEGCECVGCKVGFNSKEAEKETSDKKTREPYSREELFYQLFSCKPSHWLWGQSSFNSHMDMLTNLRQTRINKLKELTITNGLKRTMQLATEKFTQPISPSVLNSLEIQTSYSIEDMTRIIGNLYNLQETFHEAVKILPKLTIADLAHLEIADLDQIYRACKLHNEIKYYEAILAHKEDESSEEVDDESQHAHTAEEKADMLQQLKSTKGTFPKQKFK